MAEPGLENPICLPEQLALPHCEGLLGPDHVSLASLPLENFHRQSFFDFL
jgi:hypothetical protein